MTPAHLAEHAHAFGPLDTAGPVMVWVIVLGFVFVECAFVIGLFLPGDMLLFTAGVVLSRHDHQTSAWSLAAVATLVAIAGNQLGYYIGRRTGAVIEARHGGRVLTTAHLDRARRFLDRHGWWAVVLARWIPWIRTLAPLIAGAARMDARRYLAASSIGAVAWVPALVLLGFYGAGLLDAVPWLKHLLTWGSVAMFVVGTVFGLWRFRAEMRKPTERVEAGAAHD